MRALPPGLLSENCDARDALTPGFRLEYKLDGLLGATLISDSIGHRRQLEQIPGNDELYSAERPRVTAKPSAQLLKLVEKVSVQH